MRQRFGTEQRESIVVGHTTTRGPRSMANSHALVMSGGCAQRTRMVIAKIPANETQSQKNGTLR